jgi:hypothetical protein
VGDRSAARRCSFRFEEGESATAAVNTVFAEGRALMSKMCGPNVRDATELFNDMERNESGGLILDI